MRDEWAENTKRVLLEALSAWNTGNIAVLRTLLSEDAVLTSPYVPNPSNTVRGRTEVIEFVTRRQQESPQRHLVHILMGAMTVTLLLRDEVGLITWQVALTPSSQINRIDASYQVGPDFGDPE